MKKASITEAKNSLSALIDGLKAGSPVLIVDRGRPVARLEPVTGSAREEPDGRLSRLLGDRTAAGRRNDNKKSANPRTTRPRNAGMVGIGRRVRFGLGASRTRRSAR